MSSNAKKIGLGIVIAILCAIAFYFLYWIKTPAYSLNIIRESVVKHDVATFEKLRDLGVTFDVRKVPNDSKKDLFDLIKKANVQ